MVQWVYEAARGAEVGDRVVVATPDREIVDACAAFGAEAVLTDSAHESGTGRLGEVAKRIVADVYVNVQGDEPLISGSSIRACARLLLETTEPQVSSIYCECPPEEYDQPDTVKVAINLSGYALYFSRFPIPFARNERPAPILKHVGLYAYRPDALKLFSTWPMSDLEKAESLEQLRFLENGVQILMGEGVGTELAVDTPEHAARVREVLMRKMAH